MIKLRKKTSQPVQLSPPQILASGFAIVILIGMFLLNLPIATVHQESIGWIDSLFTATSAVCVTGLVVVDTGSYWSVFGQTVIAVLIQIGGLGFMTMATLFAVVLGKKISLKERLIIQQAVGQETISGVVRFTLFLLVVALGIEALGALFLAFQFVPEFGFSTGIGYAIFHSISAFCNAGFDILGDGNSLSRYATNPLINFTIMTLIITGGFGFTVLLDLYNHNKAKHFSLHTRIVLLITISLLAIGALVYLLLEWSNPATLGNLSFPQKLMASLFQSVTPRTAGFNTIDTAGLTDASLFFTIILMFIGGSPASTAGGIKTVTFGVVLLLAFSVIRGNDRVVLFKKTVPQPIIKRAITVAIIGINLIILVTMLMTIMEPTFTFMQILFEVTSAFGTVGLSTGITSQLGTTSKLLMIAMMYAGRVGILTVAFALARRQHHYRNLVHYAEEKVLVG
ncbi:TrkH family potassium uptake protein [Tindallia californiensis]|nr:TrkH family potassium uptake protein [Tindallia californiensis]